MDPISKKKHETPEMPLLLDWVLKVDIPSSAPVRLEVLPSFNEKRNSKAELSHLYPAGWRKWLGAGGQ